ncbi:MAG: GNAT family N-acetyltransferase [Nitrosopumilus sp.]|nr:GNAT family N-acetyltransferase [Nitrosopumilus sp.]
MSIKIRAAKKNDIPLVLGLLYELGRPKPEKDSDLDLFRNLVKKQIADSDKTILIAEKNDVNVVGLVSIVFLPRLNQIGQELYIPELIVTEKYRNQGIGTMLIEACVYLAKQKNCKKLRLESGNKRRESHKFYENLGFESNSLSFTKNLVD